MPRVIHALLAHPQLLAPALLLVACPAAASARTLPLELVDSESRQAEVVGVSLLQASLDHPVKGARDSDRHSRRSSQKASLLQVDAQGAANASAHQEALVAAAANSSEHEEANSSRSWADEDANMVLGGALKKQLEYELNTTDGQWPVKNKLVLAILELVGLGLCGIDRCYMGQTCVGVIKGLTLGGLTVWAFLDYVSVIITCLSMHPSINAMGMKANFTDASATAAFIVVLVALVLKLCCSGAGVRKYMKKEESEVGEAAGKTEKF